LGHNSQENSGEIYAFFYQEILDKHEIFSGLSALKNLDENRTSLRVFCLRKSWIKLKIFLAFSHPKTLKNSHPCQNFLAHEMLV